jgi:hypothetical protein
VGAESGSSHDSYEIVLISKYYARRMVRKGARTSKASNPQLISEGNERRSRVALKIIIIVFV